MISPIYIPNHTYSKSHLCYITPILLSFIVSEALECYFELFFMDTMFKKIFLFKCEIATFWFLASQHYYFSIAPGMAPMGQV